MARMDMGTNGFRRDLAPAGLGEGVGSQNMNDFMTEEQRTALRAYLLGAEVEFTVDGTPYIVDQGISVQSVEAAIRLQKERETNLGS